MGQKVQPNGIRLGIVKDWNAKWYAHNTRLCRKISGRPEG